MGGWPPPIGAKTFRHSVCAERSSRSTLLIGAYCAAAGQVAFWRGITDCVRFGYLMDVWFVPEHRRRGLATAMVSAVIEDERTAEIDTW